MLQIDENNFMFCGGKLMDKEEVPKNPMEITSKSIASAFMYNVEVHVYK